MLHALICQDSRLNGAQRAHNALPTTDSLSLLLPSRPDFRRLRLLGIGVGVSLCAPGQHRIQEAGQYGPD